MSNLATICLTCNSIEKYQTRALAELIPMPVCAYCTDDRPEWCEAWADLYEAQAEMAEDAEWLLASDCDVQIDNVQLLMALQRQSLAKQIQYQMTLEATRG